MNLLSSINAGAMIALCLWLAWAALDHQQYQADARDVLSLQGCNCTLGVIQAEPSPVVRAALDH
jgi:hypothetical protein